MVGAEALSVLAAHVEQSNYLLLHLSVFASRSLLGMPACPRVHIVASVVKSEWLRCQSTHWYNQPISHCPAVWPPLKLLSCLISAFFIEALCAFIKVSLVIAMATLFPTDCSQFLYRLQSIMIVAPSSSYSHLVANLFLFAYMPIKHCHTTFCSFWFVLLGYIFFFSFFFHRVSLLSWFVVKSNIHFRFLWLPYTEVT